MFKQVLQNLQYPEYRQGCFNVMPFINRALDLTGNHFLINQTRDDVGIPALSQFDRYQLLEIWMDEHHSFVSKVLLTMWWGGLSHVYQAPHFYINMDELQRRLNALEKVLQDTDPDNLTDLYNSLSAGDLHLTGINTSFFTKIVEFYFHSRNLLNKQNLIVPIICDKWSRRALWFELVDESEEQIRKEIFANDNTENLRLRNRNGSSAESYNLFYQYFNKRVDHLQHDFPGLTAFDLETYIFGWRGNANQAQNPRLYY